MERLGADEATLDHYKFLSRKDVELNKDITEENRFGQRSDTIPWFWTTGERNKDQSDGWMNECKGSSHHRSRLCSYFLEQSTGFLG